MATPNEQDTSSIGFFDPKGVQNLRRTLSARSQDNGSDVTATGDDFNLDKVIRELLERREGASIKTRRLGIAFRDLQVVGLGASTSYQPTIASVFDPRTLLHAIQNIRHPPVRDILHGFEGIVKPGEMLLVLGRPGSGCSTLLKMLANQRVRLHLPARHQAALSGDVQYCPEDDVHFPTLTVEQTISFAAKTRAPRGRSGIAASRSEYINIITDILITVFGLEHVRHTPIGNAAIRGVSGGEKKRVSICESLATRSRITAWDNSTRGLDASTALEFVQALRIATQMLDITTIVTIYQVAESLYSHFDKVCVIYKGKMAYFGPAKDARQYFIDMGYTPANRQTTADFLTAVTDPLARIPRADALTLPRSAEEFASYFKESAIGRSNTEAVGLYLAEHTGIKEKAVAYKESARAERALSGRKASPYTASILSQTRAVIKRRVQILQGDLLTVGLNFGSFVLLGIIMGTVFLKSPETTAAFFSRGGVLYFVLLFSALSGMNEIPALYSQRPIVDRHKKAALYHPFIEALAMTAVDIPISLVTIIVFGIIVYFLVQLQQTAGQFFLYLLFVYLATLTLKAWFRAIAAAFKSDATAQSAAGVSILALGLYTGYTIPKPSMNKTFKWITYVNPLRYGFEGIMANEFHSLVGSCSSIIPQGPGYENVTLENQVCTVIGSIPAQSTVDGARFLKLSFDYSYDNVWLDLGINIAFLVVYLVALLIFTEYNTRLSGQTSVLLFKRGTQLQTLHPHEDEEAVATEGEAIALASRAEPEKPTVEAPVMKDVFSWQHINYRVPISHHSERQLLDDISGCVVPGKLTALMGESGAGKTTLLNVLAQRTTTGVLTGNMFVNGHVLPFDFQAQTGYCQQMDTHEPFSTVREALLFSVMLRQPQSVPVSEKQAYVDKCLGMCGLESYADATVGSLGIEHRKRLTIAVELAAKPKMLLFLDEPTSGLDSQSSWAIMSFLRSLADAGQAILCTIHQPSAELFAIFDRILLLQKGGKTVYFGDLGMNSTTLINYLESHGSRPCRHDENPAEFMLEVTGAGATAKSSQDWHQVWLNSAECEKAIHELDHIHEEGRRQPPIQAQSHSEFATPWPVQCALLLQRSLTAQWRDATYLVAKLLLNAFAGIFIGVTFYQNPDSQQGTQNKVFALFLSTVISIPLGGQIQVPYIHMRNVYEIRERPSRMYDWTALVTSQLLAEIPWNIVGSSVLFLTIYWLVGFDTSRAGYTYLMLGVTFPLYYMTLALAVASMAPRAEIAVILFVPFFAFVIIFNGVLQPFSQLGWWQWMYHLSPFTYLLEGIIAQAVGNQQLECAPLEFVNLTPPSGMTCGDYMDPFISFAGGYLHNPAASGSCAFCPFRTTDQFLLASFNMMYDHHWRNFGLLMAYLAFNVSMIYFLTYVFRIPNAMPTVIAKLRHRK
ncbi:pleiotropic drug resistance ABC transporter [Hymenopellis radicata]|nr:pleiotropic drug resistance ABC transporter [Hymenopellis radicata]